jgi:hypothetical protein
MSQSVENYWKERQRDVLNAGAQTAQQQPKPQDVDIQALLNKHPELLHSAAVTEEIYVGKDGDTLSIMEKSLLNNVGWRDGDPIADEILEIAKKYSERDRSGIKLKHAPDEVKAEVREKIQKLAENGALDLSAVAGNYDDSVLEALMFAKENERWREDAEEHDHERLTEPDKEETPIIAEESQPVQEKPRGIGPKLRPREAVITDDDRLNFTKKIIQKNGYFSKTYSLLHGKLSVTYKELANAVEQKLLFEISQLNTSGLLWSDIDRISTLIRLACCIEQLETPDRIIWAVRPSLKETLEIYGVDSLVELSKKFDEATNSQSLQVLLLSRLTEFNDLTGQLLAESVQSDF